MHTESNKILLNLQGDEWRSMRGGLSPAFTAGRLRALVPTMNGCHQEFRAYIAHKIETSESEDGGVDVHGLFNRYTMGVIARAVFGVDGGTFQVRCSRLFLLSRRAISNDFLD